MRISGFLLLLSGGVDILCQVPFGVKRKRKAYNFGGALTVSYYCVTG